MSKVTMRKNNGFTLIELLIVLVILIITTAGGKAIREQKVKPIPTPTSYPTLSPIPTPILTPQPTEQPKTISCQTDADCPYVPVGRMCTDEEGDEFPPCPRFKCVNYRCQVPEWFGPYPSHTSSPVITLQNCLKQAQEARKRVCEEMNIPLDEYGNCVGVDFVKDPYQECYDKYGQK